MEELFAAIRLPVTKAPVTLLTMMGLVYAANHSLHWLNALEKPVAPLPVSLHLGCFESGLLAKR
jgi:hypothetical protein